MVWNRYLFILALCIPGVLYAQESRFIVYLSDKEGTPFNIASPEEFLSARSIARRSAQDIPVIPRDLPVSPGYLTQIAQITGKVFYPSKWLNAVVVQCTQEEIQQVLALDFVAGIEIGAPGTRLFEVGRKGNREETLALTEVVNSFQLELHGIPLLHQGDIFGQGMMVAIMDGGFAGVDTIPSLRHLFEENRVLMSENISTNTKDHFAINHGTNVLSIMAAVIPEEYMGVAPQASYLLFGTEDPFSEYRIEEYNWIVAAEKSDSAGVDVINTSLGYNQFDDSAMDYTTDNLDGATALISRGAGWAAETGMMIVVSAGNAGNSPWKLITPPADANGILAVGAVTDQGIPATFSSFGPTVDGRVKPEVVSLGVQTVLIRADGAIAVGNGTSFAAPIIAGFATLLWQNNPTMTVAMLRDYIISLSNRVENPDNQLGYGTPIFQTVTGIGELYPTVRVYPIPVNRGDRVTVESEGPILEIRLLGIDGREKTSEFAMEGKFAFVDTGGISGIFILHVITSSGKHTFKIVSK